MTMNIYKTIVTAFIFVFCVGICFAEEGNGGGATGKVGSVAGHGGTGEAITQVAGHGDSQAALGSLSNTKLKQYAKSSGAGKLSSKNGSLQKFRGKVTKTGSKWAKAAKWLKALGKAIDVVSPASRIAGHIYEGDYKGAGFAAIDECGKKAATTGGAAGGTAVGGPVGSVIGAIGAEEVYTAKVSPHIEQKALDVATRDTMKRLYGDKNFQRYMDMLNGRTSDHPEGNNNPEGHSHPEGGNRTGVRANQRNMQRNTTRPRVTTPTVRPVRPRCTCR
jgi:hypothetical protein